jgi:hypothetical protein
MRKNAGIFRAVSGATEFGILIPDYGFPDIVLKMVYLLHYNLLVADELMKVKQERPFGRE